MISLLVSNLQQENSFEIPMVYSRTSLPFSHETIAKQGVNRWPHLKRVTIPQIEAEIGLLIGSDVPQLLQPQEIERVRMEDHSQLKQSLAGSLTVPWEETRPSHRWLTLAFKPARL